MSPQERNCFITTNSNDPKLKKIMNYNKKLLNIDF